jgi:hypothetical protein
VRRIADAITAAIRSRRASSQRATANNAAPTKIPQTAIVAMPSNTDPPYASSRPSIAAPPQRASATSMSGTATHANAAVAATKSAPIHQLGDGVTPAPRLAAASQHSRNPRRASARAATIAIAPITPRESWLATSSKDACGTR